MGTRANIVIKDKHAKLIFYRHSDGYPEWTGKDLLEFVKGYTEGSLRDNAIQSAGWLILRGHEEFKQYSYDWKVGAYEPTDSIHGDIEYLYTIDLVKRVLTCKDVYSKKTVLKKSF
jgi:hypothetical protein